MSGQEAVPARTSLALWWVKGRSISHFLGLLGAGDQPFASPPGTVPAEAYPPCLWRERRWFSLPEKMVQLPSCSSWEEGGLLAFPPTSSGNTELSLSSSLPGAPFIHTPNIFFTGTAFLIMEGRHSGFQVS